MDHRDILNQMLSESCFNTSELDESVKVFVFEAHCRSFTIEAKLRYWNEDKGHAEYEILAVTSKDI